MLTAATEGQDVATGDPRISTDRLRSESLAMPFIDMATNGLSYFVVYPPRRAAQPKIRALAEVPIKLAQEA